MRAVRSRDTRPELIVRKTLRALRIGYRLHGADLPGKPDLVFKGRKKVIFVHGCYWHGHACKRGARVPKTNRDYWIGKISRNRARDQDTLRQLEAKGWRHLTIWECELKEQSALEDRLKRFLL